MNKGGNFYYQIQQTFLELEYFSDDNSDDNSGKFKGCDPHTLPQYNCGLKKEQLKPKLTHETDVLRDEARTVFRNSIHHFFVFCVVGNCVIVA